MRFYGISEEGEAEDTKETLLKCLENRFKMANARDIEFQRVHRLGKRSDKKGKPRVIIARFLRYTDREAVFSLRASLDKESEVGIGPDLPKDVVDMRKPCSVALCSVALSDICSLWSDSYCSVVYHCNLFL